jgi:outer membrane protein TolC
VREVSTAALRDLIAASSSDLRESAGKLIETALTSRPDLAARAADVLASEAAIHRAEADFFPEVKLEGNYAYSAFQYEAVTGKDKGTNAAGINGYGGFITAKWDVFDGFERVERVRKRRDEERAAREELEGSRLAATRDVWTSYHDTLSAARRMDFAEGFVVSAQENLNGYQEHAVWSLWPRAMLSRGIFNLAGSSIKEKVVNKMFHNSWVKHRSQLHFAPKSFNKMWKERNS